MGKPRPTKTHIINILMTFKWTPEVSHTQWFSQFRAELNTLQILAASAILTLLILCTKLEIKTTSHIPAQSQPRVCWSWLPLALKGRWCTLLPNSVFSDIMLVAWNQPWWEHIHYRNQPTPQKQGFSLDSQLLNTHQHNTGHNLDVKTMNKWSQFPHLT